MQNQAVIITTPSEEVKKIPVFRDDKTLEKEAKQALNSVILNPRIRHDIHVRVEDGIAEISGIIYAGELRYAIQNALKKIAGIRDIRSDILITESLADQASRAIDALIEKGSLGENPEIRVLSEHQILYLYGSVSTSKAAQDAEQAALGINGVRIVVNNLQVLQPTEKQRADPASPKTNNK